MIKFASALWGISAPSIAGFLLANGWGLLAMTPFWQFWSLTAGAAVLILFGATYRPLVDSLPKRARGPGVRMFSSLVLLSIAVLCFHASYKTAMVLENLLVPAEEPSPPLGDDCSEVVSRAKGTVYLGDSVFSASHGGVVPVLTMDGEAIISFKRRDNGVLISAQVFGYGASTTERPPITAQIIDNEIFTNPNNIFRIVKGAGNHSITVYDLYSDPVLDVRFLNRTSIKILGRFVSKAGSSAEVKPEGITINSAAITNGTLSRGCAFNTRGLVIDGAGFAF